MDYALGTDSFIKARTKLTLFYTGVILCIVLMFSIFLYTAQNNDYRRIVLQQDFGKIVPHRLTVFQRKVVLKQVKDLRTSFLYELIIIDSTILFIGGIISYFFAGITLKPINNALLNRKNFLADASHELRTPLAAIQTATEVVLRKEQKSPHVYKETLEHVQEEAVRMRNLIEELLLLSRVDMDQITITHVKVSLSLIVKKVIDELKPLAHERNITIQENLQENVFILGDEERLKQLVLILLDNAIKYTERKGKIILTVKNKPQTQIVVQDTGKGIEREIRWTPLSTQ